MTTSEGAVAAAATTSPDAGIGVAAVGSTPEDLWVERTGVRTYLGRNGRGATVEVGPIERDGSFTPGELLKLALAACTGLTADPPLARRLGDDFSATIVVSGTKDLDDDRYPLIREDLVLDLSALSDADRRRLLTVVTRSVDEHCTVGRTVTRGTTVELAIDGTPAH